MESKNLHGGFATPILTYSISCLPPGAYGVSGYRIEGKSKTHISGNKHIGEDLSIRESLISQSH
jgi:hypothetical protein